MWSFDCSIPLQVPKNGYFGNSSASEERCLYSMSYKPLDILWRIG